MPTKRERSLPLDGGVEAEHQSKKKGPFILSNHWTGVQIPTPMPTNNLTVTRTLPTADGSVGMFAIIDQQTRVVVWLGTAPDTTSATHPSIGRVLGRGRVELGPCWWEARSSDRSLGDLNLPIPEPMALAIGVQLADSLAAMHAAGVVHGAIDANAALIAPSGVCSWIGVGRVSGSKDHDVAALMTLLMDLGIDEDLPIGPISAAALVAKLREQPMTASGLGSWLNHQPSPPTQTATTLVMDMTPVGVMDEIQHELGDDAEGHGLLDRWQHDDNDSELTDDPTESVALSAHHVQTRQHILSELFQTLDAAMATPQPPGPAFRQALMAEPLDPTVALNGLQHGTIHNPLSVSERTAEVSAPEVTAPSAQQMDETTGFTGPALLQQSAVTGLLMAAVLGMVGAAIMLTLVWLILGDVF